MSVDPNIDNISVSVGIGIDQYQWNKINTLDVIYGCYVCITSTELPI